MSYIVFFLQRKVDGQQKTLITTTIKTILPISQHSDLHLWLEGGFLIQADRGDCTLLTSTWRNDSIGLM